MAVYAARVPGRPAVYRALASVSVTVMVNNVEMTDVAVHVEHVQGLNRVLHNNNASASVRVAVKYVETMDVVYRVDRVLQVKHVERTAHVFHLAHLHVPTNNAETMAVADLVEPAPVAHFAIVPVTVPVLPTVLEHHVEMTDVEEYVEHVRWDMHAIRLVKHVSLHVFQTVTVVNAEMTDVVDLVDLVLDLYLV